MSFSSFFKNFLIILPVVIICALLPSYCQAEGDVAFPDELVIDQKSQLRKLLVSISARLKDKSVNGPSSTADEDWYSVVLGNWALLRGYRVLGGDELLEQVERDLKSEKFASRVALLREDQTAGMPYGRSWLLLYLLEYEQATGRRTYRPIANFVADGIWEYIFSRPFNPALPDTVNQSWAYGCLWDYYTYTGLKNRLFKLERKIREEMKNTVSLQQDLLGGFFSGWGNLAYLLFRVYDRAEFVKWELANGLEYEALAPVAQLQNPVHHGINYSRAWAFWSLYQGTGKDVYRRAYIHHLEAGWLKNWPPTEEDSDYADRVASFGVYALTVSMDKK